VPILGVIASSIAKNAFTPTGSYDSLATYTVPSGGVSSITLAGIPSGGQYTHLQLRTLVKSSRSAVNDFMQIRFNDDTTTSNYRGHALDGDGSGIYAETSANNIEISWLPGNSNASMFGVGIIDILDYTNTSKYKTLRSLGGFNQNSSSSGTSWIGLVSGLWMSTSSINSIKLTSGTSSNFVEYTQVSLYGVKG